MVRGVLSEASRAAIMKLLAVSLGGAIRNSHGPQQREAFGVRECAHGPSVASADAYREKRRKEEEREERRRKRREAAFDAGGSGMAFMSAEESRSKSSRSDPRRNAVRAAAGLRPARDVTRKI